MVGLLLASSILAAQQDSAARTARFRRFLDLGSLVRGGTVVPHWLADGTSFWYVEGVPDSTVMLRVDPAANQVAPLLDVARVRRALAGVLSHEPPYRGLPFADLAFEPGGQAVGFPAEGRDSMLALASYVVRQLPPVTPTERTRLDAQVIRPGRYGGDPDIREPTTTAAPS